MIMPAVGAVEQASKAPSAERPRTNDTYDKFVLLFLIRMFLGGVLTEVE